MHLSTHPTSYPTRYQEIAAKLEQELRQHYRCGDYLPAEQQLAARFEVNRHTLRRAIDQLVEKGWVQRRQGVGVLVLMRPFDYPLNAQARFSQNLLDQGSHPTSEENVKSSVQNMTCITVSKVNIVVTGVAQETAGPEAE